MMKVSLTAVSLAVLLTACGGGGGGDALPVAGAGTPSAGSTPGAGMPADDGSPDVTVSGDASGGLDVNDNGGVTGSSNGGSVDVVIDNDADLSDEPITDGLLRARETIVGAWELLDPGTQCLSTLRFDDRERFVQTSLDEISSGTYLVYLDEEDDATLSLSLMFEEDNGLPDCDGDNSSSAGGFFDIYLSFPTPNRMRLSEAPGGFGNFVEFERRN